MPWEFKQQHQQPAFHDHGWKRAEMAALDDIWARLSVMARVAFLDMPGQSRNKMGPAPIMLTGLVRAELLAAGLIEDAPANKVRLAATVVGFGKRMQALKKCRLLDPSTRDMREYVHSTYQFYSLGAALDRVVTENVGAIPGIYGEEYLSQYVARRFWPDWVAKFLDDPIAVQIIECLDAEDKPIPLSSLAARFPKRRPDKVRAALDGLVNYLAVVGGTRVSRQQAVSRAGRPGSEDSKECGEGAPNGVVQPESGATVVCAEPRGGGEGKEGSPVVQKDSRGHLHRHARGTSAVAVEEKAFWRSRGRRGGPGNGRKSTERNGSGMRKGRPGVVIEDYSGC